MNNTLLGQFLKKPLTTGAVCASSESLAKELTDSIGLETAGSAAELGPGTGAVTKVILGRIPEKCRFFTVELNSDVIRVFQQKFPAVTVYNDSAANLPDLIQRENLFGGSGLSGNDGGVLQCDLFYQTRRGSHSSG